MVIQHLMHLSNGTMKHLKQLNHLKQTEDMILTMYKKKHINFYLQLLLQKKNTITGHQVWKAGKTVNSKYDQKTHDQLVGYLCSRIRELIVEYRQYVAVPEILEELMDKMLNLLQHLYPDC